jgi:hypothetical protein
MNEPLAGDATREVVTMSNAKRIGTLTAVVLLALAVAGFTQSLGELAKKEKERRAKLKAAGKTITEVDTSKYKGGAVSTAAPPEAPIPPSGEATPPAAETAAPAGAGQKNADEPVDFQGRPESYWRQTMADARGLVTTLENERDVLVLRLNDLQTKFYQEADGFKQQQIQREIQKTLYAQDVNKNELAKAQKQLQDLETEARKSGALPGWLKTKGN